MGVFFSSRCDKIRGETFFLHAIADLALQREAELQISHRSTLANLPAESSGRFFLAHTSRVFFLGREDAVALASKTQSWKVSALIGKFPCQRDLSERDGEEGGGFVK